MLISLVCRLFRLLVFSCRILCGIVASFIVHSDPLSSLLIFVRSIRIFILRSLARLLTVSMFRNAFPTFSLSSYYPLTHCLCCLSVLILLESRTLNVLSNVVEFRYKSSHSTDCINCINCIYVPSAGALWPPYLQMMSANMLRWTSVVIPLYFVMLL